MPVANHDIAAELFFGSTVEYLLRRVFGKPGVVSAASWPESCCITPVR